MLSADLVVVEVSVDGEAVSAYALQVVGAAQLCSPLDGHEAGVALSPEELRDLLLVRSSHVYRACRTQSTMIYKRTNPVCFFPSIALLFKVNQALSGAKRARAVFSIGPIAGWQLALAEWGLGK